MVVLNARQKILASVLLTGAIILPVSDVVLAEQENRYITVTGKGEVSAAPDTAWITSGVNTQAQTAEQALSENNDLMEEMIDVFNDADVEEKHIQTSGFNVSPIYDYSNNTTSPKLSGYQVTNSVTAKLTQLDKLGELLDAVVNAGSNQVSGIRFGFNEDEQLLDQARHLAMANALKKATLYANAADADVGDVLSISETGSRLPQPVYYRAEIAQSRIADAGSVPVMKGEQEISTTITVVYELKN